MLLALDELCRMDSNKMKLPDGEYRTKAGSEMTIEKNGGRSRVAFDWFEEENACCDCQPSAYEEDGRLVWSCDECGGGSAELIKI